MFPVSKFVHTFKNSLPFQKNIGFFTICKKCSRCQKLFPHFWFFLQKCSHKKNATVPSHNEPVLQWTSAQWTALEWSTLTARLPLCAAWHWQTQYASHSSSRGRIVPPPEYITQNAQDRDYISITVVLMTSLARAVRPDGEVVEDVLYLNGAVLIDPSEDHCIFGVPNLSEYCK